MSDKIIIKGLKAQCILGDYEWERKRPQTITLDVEMTCDCRPAALQDALGPGSVDYSQVAQKVLGLVETSSCRLIETLAERIAQLCLKQFPLEAVTVRLHKPSAVVKAKTVSVEICRQPWKGLSKEELLADTKIRMKG